MSDDIMFNNSPKSKDKSAKQGRRARKEKGAPPVDGSMIFDDDSDVLLSKEITNVNADAPPKPKKQLGGWGDDKRRKSKQAAEQEEDERFRPQSPKDDSDDDIPVIPELEDQTNDAQGEVEVAMAPNVVVNRVATFKELDSDLIKHASFLTLDDDIDMKILCRSLCSEQEVAEPDDLWEWEQVFTEVSSELLKEWEVEENNLKNSST